MDCRMPGFPVHYQLLKLAQTPVYRVGDAIQPSHPVIPFYSHFQSFPASGSFQMVQFCTSGGQSIGVSASTSVLPTNIQDLFPWRWAGCPWKLLSHIQLFMTPWTVHGILQARIQEWVAFPFSRGSSQPRDWTQVSRIAGGFFTDWAPREAHIMHSFRITFSYTVYLLTC